MKILRFDESDLCARERLHCGRMTFMPFSFLKYTLAIKALREHFLAIFALY